MSRPQSTGTRADVVDIEAELARFEAKERKRLGLDAAPKEHFRDAMVNPQFTRNQRPRTTLLTGGLTMAHDRFVQGALEGLGYNVRPLDTADLESLRVGKEFGNRGQCNPTHFTVGNLVKELIRMRDVEGLTSEEIIDRYVFMTAGACGPCRFGMYVTEYRKALRDAGFDGFRVMLFQHAGGVDQATGEEVGFEIGPAFFYALAKSLFPGDALNVLAYRIRPYEVVTGATDRAVEAAKQDIYEALSQNRNILGALLRARRHLAAVEVDRLRPKPKVAILGEFWAMTTEGDGNYHLQRFVQQEGGECEVQTIINLVLYNLWEVAHDTRARIDLRGADAGHFGLEGGDPALTLAFVWLAEKVLRVVWQTYANLLGLNGHELPDMDEVARIGDRHYNVELRGGEGHLEVAKLILNVVNQKTHMTLSVKPFGCMPSSGVSDGVQTAITELYPEAIFCPVETSGDGAVNFQSRVQMYLFKARLRAEAEFAQALAEHHVTADQVRAFVAGTRFAHAFYKPPHRVAGSAADLVHHVAPLVTASPSTRRRIELGRALGAVRGAAVAATRGGRAVGAALAEHLPTIARFAATQGASALEPMQARAAAVLEKAFRQAESSESAPKRSHARADARSLPLVD